MPLGDAVEWPVLATDNVEVALGEIVCRIHS
jgi:hypothetical protein